MPSKKLKSAKPAKETKPTKLAKAKKPSKDKKSKAAKVEGSPVKRAKRPKNVVWGSSSPLRTRSPAHHWMRKGVQRMEMPSMYKVSKESFPDIQCLDATLPLCRLIEHTF